MGKLRLAAMVIMGILIGGCAAIATQGSASSEGLMASVQATAGSEAVAFTLQVTNTSSAPVTLTFPSGQSYDFQVMRGDEEVWQWSTDQVFTQAVREMVVPPGQTLRYEAVWTPPAGASGEYVVIGRLTADRAVRQATTFSIS